MKLIWALVLVYLFVILPLIFVTQAWVYHPDWIGLK